VRVGGWAPHDLRAHEVEEVARDRAEGIRLAYVAATRARDLLVVPALGDEPWDGGWLDPLNRAIYPPPAARQSAGRALKCPPAKSKDSVLTRPDDRMADTRTVAPGLHVLGDYSVVWCDPRWLTLGLKTPFGVRRQELIVKDVPADVVSDGRSRYEAWRNSRMAARSHGSMPSLNVNTVRARTADPALPPLPVNPQDVSVVDVRAADAAHAKQQAGEGRRPLGPAFGLLVHAVLADVPLDAGTGRAFNVAASEGRALGASDAEVAAAAEVATQVMAHQLMARARAASARGACRREAPVTLLMPDGWLVEGVVDLAFEEGGRWIVVDYKTDWELASADEARYRRQVALYASAIAQATGLPAEGILMRV
jgi:ATP-dependent exoDNAse (exonuclease V) beta subunit